MPDSRKRGVSEGNDLSAHPPSFGAPVVCKCLLVGPDKVYKNKKPCPAAVTRRLALDWILNCVSAGRADVFRETSKGVGSEGNYTAQLSTAEDVM